MNPVVGVNQVKSVFRAISMAVSVRTTVIKIGWKVLYNVIQTTQTFGAK